MSEKSIAFLGKKNSENAVYIGSRFLALGGGSTDKIFSICIPEKDRKITHFDGENLDHYFYSNMSHFGSHFISIYFNLFLLHSFLVYPSKGSDKSTRKSSPFFEFSRIIAHKISMDLVLL